LRFSSSPPRSALLSDSLVACVHVVLRLPFTRTVDKLLGAAANGASRLVIVYVGLLGMVGAGTVLDPLTRVASIQPSQVTAMQMLLAENPQVAGFVPSGELGQLAAISSVHPVALELRRSGS